MKGIPLEKKLFMLKIIEQDLYVNSTTTKPVICITLAPFYSLPAKQCDPDSLEK